MKTLYLKQGFGGHEIFIHNKTYEENPNIKISTVLGKENVHLNRQWTPKGGGGVYTWWTVTNLEGAKNIALEHGYEVVVEKN